VARRLPLVASALVLTLLAALLSASSAGANHGPTPYQSFGPLTVTPSAPVTWTGTTATGANAQYDFAAGEPCFDPTDPASDPVQRRYCDIGLVHVDLSSDPAFWDTHGGGVEVAIGDYSPNPGSDFDLQIFASDASGTKGALVGSSTGNPGVEENFTIPQADGWYLVQVSYFAVTQSGYTGTAEFVTRNIEPPDVDVPPGLQEFLASDPSEGFRSYSEPHIAQSPLDPDILVAGSKFYNRDPQSLPEYEFKIGTFVSFDRGRTWEDLGQLAACPADQAPPESWPNNTCYPEDDPAEDDELAEEYITSDIWLQFDDEGNAFAMVLDSPPFESGNGWGMTLHRWDSVSPEDVASGDTWSDRLVINSYPDDPQQQLLLDDKNTFAVSNAGPDGDGQTGTMIACWGQNIPDLLKQQIVCERSTDGGLTWPDPPQPISGAFPLVIGVHVVADPLDPQRFSAVWLQTGSAVAGPATLEFAQTLNGGQTWTPPSTIATLDDIPRQFPGQSFRNLSLPIMAAGPSGDLNVVYAAYGPTSDPADEDGMDADIMLTRSTMMGLPGTWSTPVQVNQDTGRADQFQPYVAVNPQGQLELAFFDRRHDPENFFIDTYLARTRVAENGSLTPIVETRLSHDLWDPSINPPISSSGDFIGDYQGLVADACFAVPFVNDTHLANDPGRDPDHDQGMPRSEFQEVFSWLVPNTTAFGGVGAGTGCPRIGNQVTGNGMIPGRNGNQPGATFSLNVFRTGGQATGNFHLQDKGTRQRIRSVQIDSLRVTGNRAVIRGRCRIDQGAATACTITAADHADPGVGVDRLRVQVGTQYQGGGVLRRGEIQIA
jgi:hypothetical protein